MFRRPTVLVVGAGASYEAGLPIGGELLKRLATSLFLSFQFGRLQEGDFVIENALRRYGMAQRPDNHHAAIDLINNLLDASCSELFDENWRSLTS